MFLLKKTSLILLLLILIYTAVFSAAGFLKYRQYGYDALDLAIYNQVFHNTSQGQPFASSIHPPSYLGDHFEPLIFVLAPLYKVINLLSKTDDTNSPLALLIIQSLWLALGAIPIYLISKKVFPRNPKTPWLFVFAYLLNPFINNINLYEFHLLPLAIPLLLTAFYFYQNKKFWPFFLFILLSLLVREDVALFVFMFGVLAFIERKQASADAGHNKRRRWIWIILPIILSAVYFLIAAKIIQHFNPDENYKYLYYYEWLGQTPWEIFINIFRHPLVFIAHLGTIYNLEMILGFLLPFAFLPLLRPRYLILAMGALAQILIGAPGGSGLVLQTHYGSLFLPALFISAIYGLQYIIKGERQEKNALFDRLFKFLRKERALLLVIIIAAIIYGNIMLGPGLGFPTLSAEAKQEQRIKDHFVKQIPAEVPLAATYEFLTNLSARPYVYSLHYAFIGQRQFSETPYELPHDAEYLLIDFDDFISYQFQFPDTPIYKDAYQYGDDKIRSLIAERGFGLIEIIDTIALYKRNAGMDRQIYAINPGPVSTENQSAAVSLVNYQLGTPTTSINDSPLKLYFLDLSWQINKKLEANYHFLLEAQKEGEIAWQKIYPLGYGLYPTSEWGSQDTTKTSYWLAVPPEISKEIDNYQWSIKVIDIQGGVELDRLRGIERVVDETEIIGEFALTKWERL